MAKYLNDMYTPELNVVTGAFGFTGKYITQRLLSQGKRIKTLTGHPDRENPFGEQVEAIPFNFDNPDELTRSLQGAATLYNTYWIRFEYGRSTFGKAVENSRTLIKTAEDAGVRRIVHVSITNASEASPLPYFKGKGTMERLITESRLTYAIIRPTVVFGKEDVLINNIAWILRRTPVFAIPGSGEYRLQPVFVEDLAELAVVAGQRDDNEVFDAAGPEIFTFNELVRLIADVVHSRARITHVSPKMALFFAGIVGRTVNDVLLTRDEIEGLMANLLVSDGPPTAQTRLSEWLRQNADTVGLHYASELARHYR